MYKLAGAHDKKFADSCQLRFDARRLHRGADRGAHCDDDVAQDTATAPSAYRGGDGVAEFPTLMVS
jgi:hypothetical protein